MNTFKNKLSFNQQQNLINKEKDFLIAYIKNNLIENLKNTNATQKTKITMNQITNKIQFSSKNRKEIFVNHILKNTKYQREKIRSYLPKTLHKILERQKYYNEPIQSPQIKLNKLKQTISFSGNKYFLRQIELKTFFEKEGFSKLQREEFLRSLPPEEEREE